MFNRLKKLGLFGRKAELDDPVLQPARATRFPNEDDPLTRPIQPEAEAAAFDQEEVSRLMERLQLETPLVDIAADKHADRDPANASTQQTDRLSRADEAQRPARSGLDVRLSDLEAAAPPNIEDTRDNAHREDIPPPPNADTEPDEPAPRRTKGLTPARARLLGGTRDSLTENEQAASMQVAHTKAAPETAVPESATDHQPISTSDTSHPEPAVPVVASEPAPESIAASETEADADIAVAPAADMDQEDERTDISPAPNPPADVQRILDFDPDDDLIVVFCDESTVATSFGHDIQVKDTGSDAIVYLDTIPVAEVIEAATRVSPAHIRVVTE